MTALAAAPAFSAGRRITNITRLMIANPFTVLITPLAILVVIIAAQWIVLALITANMDPASAKDVGEGFRYGGGTYWLIVYMGVVAIQGINLSFPLALGFGSTRRDFYVGSILTWLGLSVGWALIFTIGAAVEEATGGFGLGGYFFRNVVLGDGAGPERFLTTLLTLVFFFTVGSAVATIYVRWRQLGLLIAGVGALAIAIAVAALITWADGWEAFGAFFAGLGYLGGYSLLLIPIVVAAIGGWLVLRRTTPRA